MHEVNNCKESDLGLCACPRQISKDTELCMGNIRTTSGEKARAQYIRYAKKDKRKQRKYLPKSSSIRSVSGGLPSLGKRR